MNKKLQKFLEFNKKERLGILTLLAILILLIVGYMILPRFISMNGNTNNKEIKKQVEAFIEARKKEKEKEKKSNKNKTIQTQTKELAQLTPFPFDPNDLPESKWKKIGFSKHQIQIIKNYEQSGGSFDKKEDLKKIYGINQQEYAQLEPYINIKKPEKKKINKEKEDKENAATDKTRDTLHIDLNSTDSLELIKIKGIGEVFSQRIIKYRDYLGGFYTKDQLLEVYNFDSSNYLPLKSHFWADTSNIQKVNVNTATFKELQHHPYIDYHLVKQIVNYRENHGRFKNLSELHKLELMYDELYEKLKHYLVI